MTKRSSLFGSAAAPKVADQPPLIETPAAAVLAIPAEQGGRRYPIAKTREGKRVATVYLEREALRQLQKIAFDEETTMQALLVEGINAVFQARGLSRIA